MAYVAITSNLVNSVRNNIVHLCTAETRTAPDPSQLIQELKRDSSVVQRVIDRLWEPERDLRERLSRYDREIDLRLVAVRPYYDETNSTTTHTAIELDFGKHKVPCFATVVGSGYYPRVDLRVTEDFDARLVEVFDQLAVRREIDNRWEAVAEQVVKFLESCKSLNEAVKLWPDVTRYLNRDHKERLEHNAPKKAKEESSAIAALKAMDFDTINASTVLARMSGAKV